MANLIDKIDNLITNTVGTIVTNEVQSAAVKARTETLLEVRKLIDNSLTNPVSGLTQRGTPRKRAVYRTKKYLQAQNQEIQNKLALKD